MNTQAPTPSCCPVSSNAYRDGVLARMTFFAVNWLRSQIKAYRARPRVRVVPIGHLDALIEKPCERRVIFNNRVMIIEERPARDRADAEQGD